jgi:hypothetical protein
VPLVLLSLPVLLQGLVLPPVLLYPVLLFSLG